jgi:hypothetical protein
MSISTIILIWLVIDIILFPNFSQHIFSIDLKERKQIKYWQVFLLFFIFLPMVAAFVFYKFCAKLWRR